VSDRANVSRLLRTSLIGLAIVLVVLPARPGAHDVPTDVLVHGFIKPEGQRLNLLVRVPLKAMQDIEFPRRGPGYLDLARAERALHDASTLWIADNIAMFEEDRRLDYPTVVGARVTLPADQSFATYESAVQHLRAPPLPDDTELYWEQGLLDIWLEYRIQSDQARFSIDPVFARLGLRVTTVLRFLPPGGGVRAFEFHEDPGLVRLDPRWHQALLHFTESGFFHILDGVDHLLFLFCLVIPFRRFRGLVPVVTSFTIAHSITLIASAYGVAPDYLWFPPLVETLIAISIVYMAFENIFAAGTHLQRRWVITFAFGLVHGFGFSFALRETLQFAGSHLLTSLLAFNVGVELGQVLVLVLVIPALELLFRSGVQERAATIVFSALIAHTGWHWMVERGAILSQFPWPAFDAVFLASLLRFLMVVVAAAGLMWLFGVIRQAAAARGPRGEAPVGADD
jgi:hypothetical protein